MINLINSELYRLKRQRLIPVLVIAVAAISAFSAFSELSQLSASGIIANGKSSFSNAFQDIFMLFAIAVFAGFYIGSDFSNRTIQAELSRGHSRLDIILSKAFVFSISASVIMLLYPVTACLVYTLNFGWGEPFGMASVFYILRTAILGSVLNAGTASIYICIAFLCRDTPKTICLCFVFPVVFSAISSTIGRQVPIIGKLLDYSTLSQLKYIAADKLGAMSVIAVIFSACITIIISLVLAGCFFSKAEIK